MGAWCEMLVVRLVGEDIRYGWRMEDVFFRTVQRVVVVVRERSSGGCCRGSSVSGGSGDSGPQSAWRRYSVVAVGGTHSKL